jgi:photosystem II stability/assembly factor-like uncharacterized protein
MKNFSVLISILLLFTWVVPAQAGLSFTCVSTGPKGLYSIAIDPHNINNLFAASLGNGVGRSTNGGRSWTFSTSGLRSEDNGYVYAIAVHPQLSNVLLVGAYSGIYRSVDGGQTFTPVSGGDLPLLDWEPFAVLIDSTSPNTMFVTGYDGLYRSTDGGIYWDHITNGIVQDFIDTLVMDPKNHNIIYAGSRRNGMYKSTDHGITWYAINNQLTNFYINTVAIDPDATNLIYVGSTQGDIFRSTDAGASWAKIRLNSGVDYIKKVIVQSGIPLLGKKNGLFQYTSGAGWFLVGLSGNDILDMLVSPVDTSVLMAVTYEGKFCTTQFSKIESRSYLPLTLKK